MNHFFSQIRMEIAKKFKAENVEHGHELLCAKIHTMESEMKTITKELERSRATTMKLEDTLQKFMVFIGNGASLTLGKGASDSVPTEDPPGDSGNVLLSKKRKIHSSEDQILKKKTKNAFEVMANASLSSSSPKNFGNWLKLPLKAFLKKIVEEDVQIMVGKNPLELKAVGKNSISNSSKVLRFLSTFCESVDEFRLFSGRNRKFVNGEKPDCVKERKSDVQKLQNTISAGVWTWITVHVDLSVRKNRLDEKDLTCGSIRVMLEACKNKDEKAKWKDWTAVSMKWIDA